MRLREKCPYWFDFGLALGAQCAGEAPFAGLAVAVATAFRGRFRELLSRAHTACDSEEQLQFLRLLTREERHGMAPHAELEEASLTRLSPCAVFDAGRCSMLSFQAWRYNCEERIEAAPIMRSLKRRMGS